MDRDCSLDTYSLLRLDLVAGLEHELAVVERKAQE